MRKALLIGINEYEYARNLRGCTGDALTMAALLSNHDDGSANFETKTLLSNDKPVTAAVLNKEISEFFRTQPGDEPDVLCFYFAGHGHYDEDEEGGYLVAQDSQEYSWGVGMEKLKAPSQLLSVDAEFVGNAR